MLILYLITLQIMFLNMGIDLISDIWQQPH